MNLQPNVSPTHQVTSPSLITPSFREFHSSKLQYIRKKAGTDSIEGKKESQDSEPEENDSKNSFEPFLIIPNPFKWVWIN